MADSFVRAGWWNLAELEDFGRNYGRDLAAALRAARHTRAELLAFEDFAASPREQFRRLYAGLAIREPDHLDGLIAAYSQASAPAADPYEVHRQSSAEVSKWRETMSAASALAVRRGYEESGLSHYAHPDDWP